MKQDVEKIIEIPEGIEVIASNAEVIVKGDKKEIKRKLGFPKIEINEKDSFIKIFAKKATKREWKMIGTISAHIKNMIKGIQEDFVYKLEICNVHFPMNVKVEGEKLVIKTFLGEKKDRAAKILPDVKVEVKGNQIEVSSYNLEAAGQTAANIEKATRVRGRDRRIFQDGIFITEKPGRTF